MAGNLLDVDSLSFSYGDHEVLSDISFSVESGEVVALLGPNGVGKSTLFRCILGFFDCRSGSVCMQGEDAAALTAKAMAEKVAYIPQISVPVFDYTIHELVLMGLASKLPPLGSPGEAEKAKAHEVLESLGIGHLAHCGSGNVSGGEYQLALLARALLQDAKLLIMDEPTANLDYGNQFRIMERVSHLASEGYSVILSAHDPNQVLMHASRVLVLKNGKLLADGTPRDVMTSELLSELYGIDVARADLERVSLCYPRKRKDEDGPADRA